MEDKQGAVDRVLEHFAGQPVVVQRLDGTTISAQDGSWWINLRPSNTEPYLRFNGEGAQASVITPIRDTVLGIVRENAKTK